VKIKIRFIDIIFILLYGTLLVMFANFFILSKFKIILKWF